MDVDELIDHARSMWRVASGRADTGRVELYIKASDRLKVVRDIARSGAAIARTRESGVAIRSSLRTDDHAGFAAASGLSSAAVTWASDAARRAAARVTAVAPDARVESERRDLDVDAPLPAQDGLIEWVMSVPDVEWIEAGTTIEILVGFDGWLAARRRSRVWALAGERKSQLYAQRGLSGWERLLECRRMLTALEPHPNSDEPKVLVLAPTAAATVVSALVARFHGKDTHEWVESGPGWSVTDEPCHSQGLTGGTFDDAGFPTATRELAGAGKWVGGLTGPGTLRRSSFREPPIESASNLVVAPGSTQPMRGRVAGHCRLIPAQSDVWVLELDFAEGRRWVRTDPRLLLTGCTGRMGASMVTAAGPIVPALRIEGVIAD